jgi:hypothetical protein
VTLSINNLDEVAPTITSGATVGSIDENSGAGQVIYTATSDDSADVSDGVIFSLAGDSDPALSIDPTTGEVTLSADANYEVQSVYSFTVVASDGVNEAVEQSVTLDINNLDEIAPSITSGDAAVAIDENTGAGTVIYTATADDSLDISAGVTFSLTGDSDPALSIDPSTGAVTLSADADYETQSVYSFTVVASDGVNGDVEQSVTLDINNLDEIAPSITSGDTAVAIDENTGADTVIYTAIADDSLDISAGVTFSLTGESDPALSIDPSTGAVILSADADYETQSQYSFTVVASDGVNGDVEQSVTLDVNNLDEIAPIITSDASTTTSVNENTGAGQVVYTATASDGEDASDGFSFSLADESLGFSIDASTGVVTTNADFAADFEDAQSQSFIVIATDEAGNSSEQVVSIAINNLDEIAPTITSGDSAAVLESSGADALVYRAIINDAADISAGVTFTLSEGHDPALSIDEVTGEVTLTDVPDAKIQEIYLFTVIADDGVNQSQKAVTLSVIDEDLEAPVFTSSATVAIDENIGENQVIYTAVTEDESLVTYSISEDSDTDLSINSDTGAVTLTTNPDHESQSEYSFTVIATDVTGNTSQQPVSVAINNLDEVAPSITSGDAGTAVNENSGAGQVIYTATASDTDFNGLEDITFSLADDSLGFSIDASTGVVITNTDFESNFEDAQSQSFTVVTTDGAGNASEQVVSVAINNLDEVAPSITSGDTGTAVNENSGADQVVYTATASDTDFNGAEDITFSLADESLGFSIDASTGVVTTNADFAADYENTQLQSFTVVATDGAGNASEQVVSVAINNLDEVAPSITSGDTGTAVNENSGADQVVYTATASDTDFNGLEDITFSLADDSLGFSIDASTGVVTTNTDFESNFEDAQSQSFTVVATDAAGNASEQVVSVAINNLDEVAPSITSGDTGTAVDENSGADQVVYTATASDTDFNGLEDITFSLADESLGFSIDASTGVVTTNTDFESNFEDAQSQSFTVVATDAAGNASEQVVNVAINNLDEVAPSITSGDTGTAVNENSGADQVVYTATASDTDFNGLEDITFSLADNSLGFSIDASTGVVTTNTDFESNYEDDQSQSFTVVATDGAGNASEQVVSVAINNLDEVAPSIDSGDTATAVDENSGEGQVVYTATASDTDFNGAEDITFSLADDSLGFSIDADTGVVTTNADFAADYENTQSQSFTVVATDAAGNASEQVVSVAINNLDEVAPSITSGDTGTAVNENSGEGQVVYTATATDDADTSDGLSFSLADESLGFSIDASTGVVTTNADFAADYEDALSQSFTVVATDVAGNASEQVVSVAINNLDEVAPSITSGDTATAIDENSGEGQVVYTATASDTDFNGLEDITFILSDSSDPALSIDSVTGEVTLSTDPNHEVQPSYNFAVIATDAAGNVSEAQSVTLDINDLDDTAPSITSGDTGSSVDENSGAGQVIYTAIAVDSTDVVDTPTADNSNDTGSAVSTVTVPDLVEATQHVYVSSSTKSEDGTQETIVISYNAEDTTTTGLGIRVHFDSSAININGISDIFQNGLLSASSDPDADDDNRDGDTNTDQFVTFAWVSMFSSWPNSAPVDLATITFDVDEDATGTSAINFTASSNASGFDFDGQTHNLALTAAAEVQASPITFSLADESLGFSIDADGVVTTNASFEANYEDAQSQSFTVVATDVAGNASEQVVNVAINNLDEVAPSITSGDTGTAVNENSGEGQVVYTATASDTDFNGLKT